MPAIDQYKVTLYGQSGNEQTDGQRARALISLRFERRTTAICEFYDGDNVPDNTKSPSGLPILRYPWSCYSGVLDLLRNEEPLFWRYLEPSKTGFIATHSELVGEGEED